MGVMDDAEFQTLFDGRKKLFDQFIAAASKVKSDMVSGAITREVAQNAMDLEMLLYMQRVEVFLHVREAEFKGRLKESDKNAAFGAISEAVDLGDGSLSARPRP